MLLVDRVTLPAIKSWGVDWLVLSVTDCREAGPPTRVLQVHSHGDEAKINDIGSQCVSICTYYQSLSTQQMKPIEN